VFKIPQQHYHGNIYNNAHTHYFTHIIIPLSPGPYYPLGTIDTIPRAYDILGPTKKWKGEQIKIKALKIGKFNTKYKIQTQK
jgi:hypothetical protein